VRGIDLPLRGAVLTFYLAHHAVVSQFQNVFRVTG
jgi:hypothetical protein